MSRLQLSVHVPERVLLETVADKVVAEGQEGSFALLPRHVDFVAPLVPGILNYWADGEERFVGHGEGILVKQGEAVGVSVRHAVLATDLGQLEVALRDQLRTRGERERQVWRATRRLEADMVRRLVELRQQPG